MKIEIKNLDEELTLNVGAEDIRTGQSIGAVSVAPGQTAVVEVTEGYHLTGAPSGPSAIANGSNIPDGPALKPEAAPEDVVLDVLTDATDQDIADALKVCAAAGAETTKSGKIEIAALNAELLSKNFRSVTAAKRDEVSAVIAA